ncbi:hypothetical protein ElyMa_002416800 [Elysia marginata]|uniref:Uncharacterized protein n=1 Tax=Elysia marginata TaxID=1093978 RepID=A0AAV4GFH4_9GAST|nr:hypothetical protein ElyMa_002416800 [Elysia marginata]
MPLSGLSKPEKKERAPATESKYLEIYSPKYMGASSVLSKALHPADVLHLQEVPSIGLMIQRMGNKKVAAVLKLHLLQMNDLLDLNKPLSGAQIDYVAEQVLVQHKTLTMVDIHLVCKRALNGVYGEFYERLNPPKVLKWFADYFEERCRAAVQMRETAHVQFKESPHDERSSEVMSVKEWRKNKEARVWYTGKKIK